MSRSVLILVCIICVFILPLVSAEYYMSDQEISDNSQQKCWIKNLTQKISSGMLDLDSLSNDEERLLIPPAVKKYDLVIFDHKGINTDLRAPSPHLSFLIYDTDYSAILKRMDFEVINDGIDSYTGILTGEPNSSVLLTISNNATIGSVTLNDETFYFEPVQIKALTTDRIPHIIYSSNDVENREFPIDNGPINSNDNNLDAEFGSLKASLGNECVRSTDTASDGRTAVTVLIVTDNQFYSDHSGYGWNIVAQDIIAEANRQFGRDDIGVILIPIYDDSKRLILTNNLQVKTNPLYAFMDVYPFTSLDETSADLGLYLGGYDKTTDNDQGLSNGYGNATHPYYGRYSWAQMVADDPLYLATTKGRRIITIHELGHQFGAHHDDGDTNPLLDTPGYNRAFSWGGTPPFDLRSVMWHEYSETASTYEFSSSHPSYMGDEMHDNARRIRETKGIVSGYASCSASLPYADFEWSPDISNLPAGQKISFSAKYPVVNNPLWWYWEFGDGATSTKIAPDLYAYSEGGTYTVKLTVANCAGSSTTEHNITIKNPVNRVGFFGSPQTGTVPLTVQFNGTSSLVADNWSWDFGDGTTSSDQNPQHTYHQNGIYVVSLTVFHEGISSTKILQNYIDVAPQGPRANFTALPTSRLAGAPLTVRFADTSTNTPDEWQWNFGDGDGTNKTLKNPVHTFTKNGTFTVSLTATNRTTGSKGITRIGLITAGPLYTRTSGSNIVLIFNRTGSTKWMPPAGVTKVDYLVVAGGGEGGNGGFFNSEYYPGGGGGGGGVLTGSAFPVSGTQTVIIGAGGSGTSGSVPNGANGGISVFGTLTSNKTAIGGGGGGGWTISGNPGMSGGSGGGGSGSGTPGGPGNSTQGNAGGAGNNNLPGNPAGGGGGAGTPGITPSDPTIGGPGGDGRLIDITGSPVYYGSGGGGGIGSADAYGAGGVGCGADGSRGTANPAKCQGTGAGGGGAGCDSQTHGAGGSGSVIIWYQTSDTLPIVANFSAIPVSGSDPMTVTFTDMSTGAPTSWFWDFGDGDNSNCTIRNPIHRYTTRGSYTISLTAANSNEINTTIKSRYINAGMGEKIGVFRKGTMTFYFDANGNGTWDGTTRDRQYQFGNSHDIPLTGDWNGDRKTEIGVFRPSTHRFLLDYNGNGTWDGIIVDREYNFGTGTDDPIIGDWNGDGMTDIGIFRNSTRRFFLDYNGNGVLDNATIDRYYIFGNINDTPVSGDWNNDGRTEIGTYNLSRYWFIDLDGNGSLGTGDPSFRFVIAGDIPMTGDWNNDGITDVGVYINATHRYYLDYDSDRKWNAILDKNLPFLCGDYPISGKW